MRSLMTCTNEFSGGWQSVKDVSKRPALPTAFRRSFVRRKNSDVPHCGVCAQREGATSDDPHEPIAQSPGNDTFVITDVMSDELLPAIPEVIISDNGYVPQPGQGSARHVLYRPNDILAQSDLLNGNVQPFVRSKTREHLEMTNGPVSDQPEVDVSASSNSASNSDRAVGSVELIDEGYLPRPEQIKGGNIHVRPDDLVVKKKIPKKNDLTFQMPLRPNVPENVGNMVEMFAEGFVPAPETVKGENIHVTANDMLAGQGKMISPSFRPITMTSKPEPIQTVNETDAAFLERMVVARKLIVEHIGRVVVGQKTLLEGIMIAMVARGHCLIEGVPGLAKMSLVSTLAKLLGLQFRRITLTPDTSPEDIAKVETVSKHREMRVGADQTLGGPLFFNVILAEEINRTSPKTQTALLDTLHEKKLTIGHVRYPLPAPHFVVATENPIEQPGTSPLTSAQRDLFMMKLVAGYPTFEEEFELIRRNTDETERDIAPVISTADFLKWQRLVASLPADDEVTGFAVELVRQTRVDEHGGQHDFVSQQVAWGASPRAAQHLLLAAKARAAFAGRTSVTRQDVSSVLKPVLRHRLIMQPTASLLAEQVIEQLD